MYNGLCSIDRASRARIQTFGTTACVCWLAWTLDPAVVDHTCTMYVVGPGLVHERWILGMSEPFGYVHRVLTFVY